MSRPARPMSQRPRSCALRQGGDEGAAVRTLERAGVLEQVRRTLEFLRESGRLDHPARARAPFALPAAGGKLDQRRPSAAAGGARHKRRKAHSSVVKAIRSFVVSREAKAAVEAARGWMFGGQRRRPRLGLPRSPPLCCATTTRRKDRFRHQRLFLEPAHAIPRPLQAQPLSAHASAFLNRTMSRQTRSSKPERTPNHKVLD